MNHAIVTQHQRYGNIPLFNDYGGKGPKRGICWIHGIRATYRLEVIWTVPVYNQNTEELRITRSFHTWHMKQPKHIHRQTLPMTASKSLEKEKMGKHTTIHKVSTPFGNLESYWNSVSKAFCLHPFLLHPKDVQPLTWCIVCWKGRINRMQSLG